MAEVEVTFVNVPPDADQVTPAAPTSLVTTAVTCRACVVVRPPRLGERLTLTVEDTVMVMIAAAVLVASRTDFAVRVTVGFVGRVAGAV